MSTSAVRVEPRADQYVNRSAPPASTLVEVRRLFRDDALLESKCWRRSVTVFAFWYTLLVIGLLLVVTWIVSMVAIAKGISRLGARTNPTATRSSALGLRDLAGLPLPALAMTVNLVCFVRGARLVSLAGKSLAAAAQRRPTPVMM